MKYLGIPIEGFTRQRELELPPDTTIQGLLETFTAQSDTLTDKHFRTCTFLLNGKTAMRDSVLHHGDALFILGILGGG
jgi:sulfur carrier protein ThiS